MLGKWLVVDVDSCCEESKAACAGFLLSLATDGSMTERSEHGHSLCTALNELVACSTL